MTKRKLLEARVDVLLGGRAAEEVVFGEISTGAHNDLERATDIVRAMILEYGMGETLGRITFPRRRGPAFLGDHAGMMAEPREYSEATAQALDSEVKRMLDGRLAHVVQLLTEKRPLLDRVSKALLEKETLEAAEFEELVTLGRGRRQERRLTARGGLAATIRARAPASCASRRGSARPGGGAGRASASCGRSGTSPRG